MVVTSQGPSWCTCGEAWEAARHFAVRGTAPGRGQSSPACQERGRRDTQPGDESKAGRAGRTEPGGRRFQQNELPWGRRDGGHLRSSEGPPRCERGGRPRPAEASPGASRVVQTGRSGHGSGGSRRPRARRGHRLPGPHSALDRARPISSLLIVSFNPQNNPCE